MPTEFNLKKVYVQEWSKERLIKCIQNLLDEKLQVIVLPTDKDKADLLIRCVKTNEEVKE